MYVELDISEEDISTVCFGTNTMSSNDSGFKALSTTPIVAYGSEASATGTIDDFCQTYQCHIFHHKALMYAQLKSLKVLGHSKELAVCSLIMLVCYFVLSAPPQEPSIPIVFQNVREIETTLTSAASVAVANVGSKKAMKVNKHFLSYQHSGHIPTLTKFQQNTTLNPIWCPHFS